MDFLEPDRQKTYEKCKYIVKVWEHKFQKKYKRIPSKLDIREAAEDVRNAYKKYFRLKSELLDQSFKGIDGFDDDEDLEVEEEIVETQDSDVTSITEEIPTSSEIPEKIWGTHLNNVIEKEQPCIEKPKLKLNLNISKKLFCGSKFSKRNPRKSLSSQKNKTDSISCSQTTSFTTFSSEEALNSLQNEMTNSVAHIKGSLSQPANAVQTFYENSRPRVLKTIDPGWLKRIAGITGISQENADLILPQNVEEKSQIEPTKLDYDSDIIENSDEEENSFNCSQTLHMAKKRKIENVESVSNKTNTTQDEEKPCEAKSLDTIHKDIGKNADKQVELPTLDQENSESTNPSSLIKDKNIKPGFRNTPKRSATRTSPRKNIKPQADLVQIETSEESLDKIKQKTSLKATRPKQTPKKRAETKTPKKKSQSPSQISQRRSSRKTKLKVSLQEFSSGEEDAFHTDTDEKDPEFALYDDKKMSQHEFSADEENTPKKSPKPPKKSPKTSKKRASAKKVNKEVENEEENDTYDLEFTIEPRIVAPRYGSIKKLLIKNKTSAKEKYVEKVTKTKNQQAQDKLEQKISSGTLNDNYVRINIKKKVFVRGKSGMNFSKYKKNNWKKAKALAGSDMYMGGCDGGMLTCFNCGQTGHFAQRCPAKKGDSLLALNSTETEEECTLPTLQEASKMAQESNLSIRTPKLALKEIQNSNNQEEDPFTDDEFDSEELLLETLRLEEHVKKLDVQMYLDNVKVVEPYYDDTITGTPPEVFEALRNFGHTSFRPGQEQAIMRILSGKSTLVTLSTGSGKSLCYQLPAYMYARREPCISLIISPLVSLMDDQVLGIAKFMKAACLHSNQTAAQRKNILEAISLGELSILLVSPEAVVSGEKQKGFSSFLRKLPPIAFACIDEAHCVSQWSHNFRPSYLMICRVLRQSLGIKTILGLTATATRATQASIIEHLQILDGEKGVISDIPLPDNLQLSVSKDANRDNALIHLLLSDRFKDCNSIIVYCTRRQECERIAGFLRTSLKNEQPVPQTSKKRKRVNLIAEPYHAGLSASRRRTIQSAFMSGDLKIVVATVAFGMGINKSDIRSVIHYNMPRSFESYVQEVGRAGRDGLKAHCHVFLDSRGGDENELRRHIYSNSIDRHVIRKLLEKIFISCSCTNKCPKHEVAFSIESTVRALDIPEENISTLLCYLELHQNRYIELLSPGYIRCKVISYSGSLQIRKAAKECPPLAMALALEACKEDDSNILEFPVIDVAAAMGWESGICKHKLKNLEWTTVNNQQKRSALSVKFFDLGFRLLAPGNLTNDQLDEALDNLYNRVVEQEKTALLQLNCIHQTLCQFAKPSYQSSLSPETDNLIKSKIRDYFNSPDPLKMVKEIEYPEYSEEQLLSDIQALILMYRDNNFTGKAVARIFQGIQSPNYPATIWGRCKFWRSHLNKDFHVIVRAAAKEIIKLR